MVDYAKQMQQKLREGVQLNLTEDEQAFYDALADNQSAKDVLGDKVLMAMARELVETIHKNVKVDWTMRESVQANLRIEIKRLLKRYKYPPDLQQKATDTVLEQAKEVAKDWAETHTLNKGINQ
jgi:type I restriction enzyme R subunit